MQQQSPIQSETDVEMPVWSQAGSSRIPFWAYTDPEVYQRELQRIFYTNHWNYVGLEAEIPNPGDFKRSSVGERSIVIARDTDGSVTAVENICAHRGAQFCREKFGNTKEFLCPYHQWTYDLKGNLQGVPFRRGLKKDGEVRGGMPADFKPTDHPLNKLKVAVRNGVIFASFDHDIESFESYLGPEILAYFDRVFNGRKLKVMGYSRQRVPSNWKLMQENIKDPYHVGLLHTWFVVFGLIRGDQKSRLVTDVHGRHGAMASTREKEQADSGVTKGVASFKEGMILHDKRIVDVKPEAWWNGPTVVMLTLFPNLIVQQQSNSMSTRQIMPRGPGSFDFVWTHFGFEEDDADMSQRRLRQANMFGPAGYVSADDGEVLEFCQQSYEQEPTRSTLAEQGGRDWGEVNHLITENPIRAMFSYWRKVMEI